MNWLKNQLQSQNTKTMGIPGLTSTLRWSNWCNYSKTCWKPILQNSFSNWMRMHTKVSYLPKKTPKSTNLAKAWIVVIQNKQTPIAFKPRQYPSANLLASKNALLSETQPTSEKTLSKCSLPAATTAKTNTSLKKWAYSSTCCTNSSWKSTASPSKTSSSTSTSQKCSSLEVKAASPSRTSPSPTTVPL